MLIHYELDKMNRISPKIEIINHFDNLINRVDIDIELSLEKYQNEQILSVILLSSETDRKKYEKEYENLKVEFHEKIDFSKSQTVDLWPESTKVADYLNQVRMRTIAELRNAQKERLEYYKLNSWHFEREQIEIDQLKSQLFAENFYFEVHFTKKTLLTFSLFTFACDFYVSPSDINTLE